MCKPDFLYPLDRSARYAGALLLLASLCVALPAAAFSDLTPAQNLVYDNPHLANTDTGDVIEYRYDSEGLDGQRFNDAVTLTVNARPDETLRDVSLNFLSGQHRLALPDFEGYRGNPVIIATLEQFARTFSAETGGGTLYFRNRLRDALASDKVELATVKSDFNGKSVDSQVLTMQPFVGDAYLGGKPEYRNAIVEIVISDQVPAGVLRVQATSTTTDQDKPFFSHRLSLTP